MAKSTIFAKVKPPLLSIRVFYVLFNISVNYFN